MSGRAPAAWFLAALVTRAAYLAAHGIVLSDDSAAYLRIANNLVVHGSFSLDPAGVIPTVRYAPAYPAVLAALQWLGVAPTIAVVWLQAAADALTTALVFLMAARVAPRRWAHGAAAMYALHPGAIAASVSVLTETLFTWLIVSAAALVTARRGQPGLGRTAVAGGLLGIASLGRPIGLAYVLVIAAAVAFAQWRARDVKQTGRSSPVVEHARSVESGIGHYLAPVVLAGAAAVVIAPWAWRSSAAAGRFVPVQAASPVLFYLPTRTDWDQRDQAALWPAFVQADPYGRLFTTARTPREMIDADAVGRRLAVENIRRHPGDYLRSRLKTVPYLVLTSFDTFTGRTTSFGAAIAGRDWIALATKLGLMALFCALPLCLAVAGALTRPHDLTTVLAVSLWISTLILHLPMWIEPRFWLPAVPFVLITAAHAAYRRSPAPFAPDRQERL